MSSGDHIDLHSWSTPFPITVALAVSVLVYWRGWRLLRNAGPNVTWGWRLAAFVSGVFTLWAAIGSPLAAADHVLLTAHMVQHLLVMTVAAPLILLGAPLVTVLNGLPRLLVNRALMPLARCSSVPRLESTVAQAVFCWFASTTAVIAWHTPTLFALGLQSEWWHGGEQACFLIAGLLFWWPVIQPGPSLAKYSRWFVPLYLFLATLPCDALSAFLTFCDRVVYPHYLSSRQVFSISPLGDQECAGALMWVWVTFAYLAPATAVTIQLLSPVDEAATDAYRRRLNSGRIGALPSRASLQLAHSRQDNRGEPFVK